ncbi:MAG: type II toxin-antitoxin system HicA family toxin [Chromatiaceae bacterium]|nr:MAG: type II toxin-antitoxin system HicA family toxin [Chromatiaceae bacterium]
MNRSELIRHLRQYGCELAREGSRHSIWGNPKSGQLSAVPRHAEVKEHMARKICKDLDIPQP